MTKRTTALALFVAALVGLCFLFLACGGGNSRVGSGSSTGTVTVRLSDPPTCSSASSGPFSHVYVTVADVQVNTSANAGDNDSGWVDLTTSLKSAPQQIDLLGTPSNGCFLAQLGTAGIPAGTYQQVRLILADNSVTPANNQCKTAGANCVVLATDANNPRTLQLSSESRTGIKIPSGQIAGGGFTIASGETKDLDIDFDACASIVAMGNGGFRLKPVLHAGAVATTNSTAIVGRLVDATGSAIPNSKAIVALEQKDSGNVDRVILQTTADANGNFSLCPVPAGSYDVVVVAVGTVGNVVAAYGPTLITNISPGTTLGVVALPTSPAGNGGSSGPASLIGTPLVTSPSGTAVDYQVSALQQVTIGSSTTPVAVTIPLALQQSATATLTTGSAPDCPSGTWCADAGLAIPAANITVGTLSGGLITYTAAAVGDVKYQVEAQAFSTSTHSLTCAQSKQLTAPTTVTAGSNFNIAPLAFTGCQ